jgi:hypothetical protein
VKQLNLGVDQVYNGFAVAGSSAAEQFPVPSLRLFLVSGDSVLLDRGSRRRLKGLGMQIAERLERPLEIDTQLAFDKRGAVKSHDEAERVNS